MKTIAAKYIAPLVLAVGITGGFVGFELSKEFSSQAPANDYNTNKIAPHGDRNHSSTINKEDDRKKKTTPGAPRPIL